MIVTRSRKHAVRYVLALREEIKRRKLPYKALVAFSDTVDDGNEKWTEEGLNRSYVRERLFELYIRSRRNLENLIAKGESLTLELKSTLRYDLKQGVKNDKVITHAVLKTIAAFLNTRGGDLLIGVADDGGIVGIEVDGFANDDKFKLHEAIELRPIHQEFEPMVLESAEDVAVLAAMVEVLL